MTRGNAGRPIHDRSLSPKTTRERRFFAQEEQHVPSKGSERWMETGCTWTRPWILDRTHAEDCMRAQMVAGQGKGVAKGEDQETWRPVRLGTSHRTCTDVKEETRPSKCHGLPRETPGPKGSVPVRATVSPSDCILTCLGSRRTKSLAT